MSDPMKPTRTAKDAVAEHRAKRAAKAPPVPPTPKKPAPPPKPEKKMPGPGKASRSPAAMDQIQAAKGRLPPQSRIEMRWDGDKWLLRMFVVTFAYGDDGNPTGPLVFEHEGKKLFRSLVELDDKYREWLIAQQPAAAEAKS